jgi:hypothetical protein
MNKLLRRAPLFAAVPVLFAAVATGCGSSGSSSDAPSQPAAAAAPSASSSQQAGAVEFAQCMRTNGVTNFPDPQDGRFLIPGGVQSNPHFQAAVRKCQHFLGPNGVGSHSNTSAELAYAQCMQTHGVPQFPDPQPNGAIGLPSGTDPSSPTFRKAQEECKSLLPGSGPGTRS